MSELTKRGYLFPLAEMSALSCEGVDLVECSYEQTLMHELLLCASKEGYPTSSPIQ